MCVFWVEFSCSAWIKICLLIFFNSRVSIWVHVLPHSDRHVRQVSNTWITQTWMWKLLAYNELQICENNHLKGAIVFCNRNIVPHHLLCLLDLVAQALHQSLHALRLNLECLSTMCGNLNMCILTVFMIWYETTIHYEIVKIIIFCVYYNLMWFLNCFRLFWFIWYFGLLIFMLFEHFAFLSSWLSFYLFPQCFFHLVMTLTSCFILEVSCL